MEQVKNFDFTAEQFMSDYLKKPTVIKGVIHLFLVLYAARVAPRPPQVILDLFENQYFKLFFFSLILWTAQFSPSTSLLIAIAFMVTMNYVNKKALWEFMENVESNSTPTAPSKEVAIETSTAIVENQVKNTEVVSEINQTPETIVIQPIVTQTPEGGQSVQNPTVVIAPAVVSDANGQKLVVTPDVNMLELPSQQAAAPEPAPIQSEMAAAPALEMAAAPAPEMIAAPPAPEMVAAQPAPEMIAAQPAPEAQAAVAAISALAEAAASPEPTAPQQVAELTQIATAAVTTTEAAQAVEKLAQQAVKPEAAPVEAVKETAMTAIQEIMTPPAAVSQPMKEEAGCYPIRRYDMSKVSGYSANDFYGSF